MYDFQAETSVEKILTDDAYEKRIPISGTFELLPLCNLNCKMCYIRMTPEEAAKQGRIRTAEEWIDLARQAVDQGMLFLLLTGGEPLLYKEFQRVYKEVRDMGVYMTINTNGTMINEKMVDFLMQNMPRRVNITLYGTGCEPYEQLCGNGKMFHHVQKAVHLLKERNIPVKLNATISRYNFRELDKIMELADQWQVPIEIPYYLFPQVRRNEAMKAEEYRLSAEEAAILRYKIVENTFKDDQNALIEDIKYTLNLIDQSSQMNMPEKPLGFWCQAGHNSFWANWKGEMANCGMIEQPAVKPFDMGFQGAWERLLEKSTKVELSEKCYHCKYFTVCSPCAASMYAETGVFSGVPEYRCEVMREYERLLRDVIKKRVTR